MAAMQTLLAQIQDLSSKPPALFAQLHTALKAAETGLQQAVHQNGNGIIVNALQTLSPLQHTLGIVYLLCALFQALSKHPCSHDPAAASCTLHTRCDACPTQNICGSSIRCGLVKHDMPHAQECVGQPRHGWAGQRALCLGRLASVPGGRRPPVAGRAQRKCVPIYACTCKMDLGSPHVLPQIQAAQIVGFDCISILSVVFANPYFFFRAAAKLAGCLRDHIVAMQIPRRGILPLRSALEKVAPLPEYITPMHAMFFQWCALCVCWIPPPALSSAVIALCRGKGACRHKVPAVGGAPTVLAQLFLIAGYLLYCACCAARWTICLLLGAAVCWQKEPRAVVLVLEAESPNNPPINLGPLTWQMLLCSCRLAKGRARRCRCSRQMSNTTYIGDCASDMATVHLPPCAQLPACKGIGRGGAGAGGRFVNKLCHLRRQP